MRKRFIAIFLASGLILEVCGCGSNASTVEYVTQQNQAVEVKMGQEDAFVQDDSSSVSNPIEAASATLSVGQYLGDYSVDELADMLLSGEITMADVESNVATGDVSYEDYEEILTYFPDDLESDQSVTRTETNEHIRDTDTLSLLTTHAVEYEDQDGYKIRETIQLSPIFREDDMETVYVLWELLGNDVSSFPSEEKIYNSSYLIRNSRDQDSCDKLEYIVGTFAIENLTDGFSITPDKPREYFGGLQGEYILSSDERSDDHDGNAANFINVRSVSMVMYDNGPTYYGEGRFAVLGNPKMTSDAWGPVCFVIAVPNGATPNRPDGYRYDKAWIEFGHESYGDAGYDVFRLEYYE